MTENENPLAVRWDTEHEDADLHRLWKVVGDDFAISLDRNGWEIRMKDGCRSEQRRSWAQWTIFGACRSQVGKRQLGAFHDEGTPQRQVEYKPYPSAEDLIFGRYNNR